LVGVDKSNVMMDSFIYSMIMINHRERKEAKLGDCVLIQIKRGIQNILYSCLSKHFQYQYLYQYQYAQPRLPTKKKGKRHAVHTYAYWKMQVGHWHYQILLDCDGY
jgi:hypothetical protein